MLTGKAHDLRGPRFAQALICASIVIAGTFFAPANPVSADASTGYTSMSPVRLLDTRFGGPTVDGQFSGLGLRPYNSTVQLTVAGRGGVPQGAASIVLNITVVDAQGEGFLTAYPCDAPRPTASNLNYVAGQTVANLVVSRIPSNGAVCLYTLGATHVIADVAGYFVGTDSLTTLPAPVRLLDTRPGSPTADGQAAGTGIVAAGQVLQVPIGGRAGVPSGIASVVLNVTATNTADAGFVSVYPCDTTRTITSNLNFVAGQTVPNTVIARVPAAGAVCLFTSAASDLIVDVSGYFVDESVFTPLATPARLLDTRPGMSTSDGKFAGTGLRPTGGTLALTATMRSAIPRNVSAVILNVTATEPTAAGFLTVHPPDGGRPLASNLNYAAGATVPNAVIAPVGRDGTICLFNNAPTQMIVDVVGYIKGVSNNNTGPACPADVGKPQPPSLPPTLPTFPPVPPPMGVPIYAPGQYSVNSTLPPGRYMMRDAAYGCVWERQSGLGGTVDEVLASHIQAFTGTVLVDVLPSDAGFAFNSACGSMWQHSSYPSARAGIAGSFIVGQWMPPGRYAANASEGCYWERSTSFAGDLASIIDNDYIEVPGTYYVTVRPDDVGFYATGDCHGWFAV